MLPWIQTANFFVNNLVWGLPAMVCIIALFLLSGTVVKLIKEYQDKP